jgi:hypothetical protein
VVIARSRDLFARPFGASSLRLTRVAQDLAETDDARGSALFPAADDWDIAFRSLLHGWSVYDPADIFVVHYGLCSRLRRPRGFIRIVSFHLTSGIRRFI